MLCIAPVQSRKSMCKCKVDLDRSACPEGSHCAWCGAPVQSRKSTVKWNFNAVLPPVRDKVTSFGAAVRNLFTSCSSASAKQKYKVEILASSDTI